MIVLGYISIYASTIYVATLTFGGIIFNRIRSDLLHDGRPELWHVRCHDLPNLWNGFRVIIGTLQTKFVLYLFTICYAAGVNYFSGSHNTERTKEHRIFRLLLPSTRSLTWPYWACNFCVYIVISIQLHFHD